MIRLRAEHLYVTLMDEYTSAYLVLNNIVWVPVRQIPKKKVFFYRSGHEIEISTKRSYFLR